MAFRYPTLSVLFLVETTTIFRTNRTKVGFLPSHILYHVLYCDCKKIYFVLTEEISILRSPGPKQVV